MQITEERFIELQKHQQDFMSYAFNEYNFPSKDKSGLLVD